MRILKAAIFGSIILFIWGFISWMYLPWHNATMHNFKDEKAVAAVIQTNVKDSGMYLLSKVNDGKTEIVSPIIFTSVFLQGNPPSMTMQMGISFITQFIAALLVAWMISKTTGLNYFGRVWFTVIFGLAAGIVTEVPLWNWFRFDTVYILLGMADLVIGWFLAGLVMACCCRQRERM